jgi:hypothetical protein
MPEDSNYCFSADFVKEEEAGTIQLNSKIHYSFWAFLHMILNLKMDSLLCSLEI